MDIKPFYIEKGQGDPIILLHGNGEDSNFFEHQIEALSDKYHVFAIDSRAHGKTERGEKPLTIRQLSEDLYEFINEHNLDVINILGFSDGANVAMIFTMDHPERVNKIILNGGNLSPDGMIDKLHASIVRHYEKAVEESDNNPKAFRKMELFGLMVNDPNIDPKDLAVIDKETLVIAGTNDMIKEEHTKLIADSIKGSELVFLEGDHFIANKEPEAFNKVIIDFLAK